MRNRSGASGNILFLILLAVILFAALSYAVTHSMRSGDKTGMSKEAAKAAAAQLMNYGALVENTVMRMSFTCRPETIEYWGTNTSCPSNACRLYHAEGGGLASFGKVDDEYLLNPTYSGSNIPTNGNRWHIRAIQVAGVGSDKPEIALVAWGIKKEICAAINEVNNVTVSNSYGVPVRVLLGGTGAHHLYNTHTKDDILFNTSFFRNAQVGTGIYAPEVAYKNSFCLCESSTCSTTSEWRYSYWHVILVQ